FASRVVGGREGTAPPRKTLAADPRMCPQRCQMPSAAVRNVILIISDTLRRDCVGAYGPPPWFGDRARSFTPHLDAFSARCSVFERAFSSSFPTVPLRNDVLTGRATFTYKPCAPLAAADATLQEMLNRAAWVRA